MPNVCIASIWHVGLSRHICAVDLDPLGLDPMGLGPMGLGPMGLGPLGRCGPETKEQKNVRQWDVED